VRDTGGSSLTRGPLRRSAAALVAVWALTLLVLAGGAVWLQLSYTAPPDSGTDEAATTGEERKAAASDPAVAVDARASSEGGASEATGATDSADETVPRAGESADDANASAQVSGEPPVAGSTTADRQAEAGSAGRDAEAAEGDATAEIRLTPAPDPDLVESAEAGLLPVAGDNGRKPWRVYSRPFLGDSGAPRIAIVIQGIGLSQTATTGAIETLPPAVTLAISPYADSPQEVARRAREAGHEVLLMVPMEPYAYPDNDPGPHTLLIQQSGDERMARLHHVMSRFQGYVGLVNHMGSRFTASREALEPVMSELAGRGVLFLDARSSGESLAAEAARSAGVPAAVNDRYIDNTVSAEAIDGHLADLEATAEQRGWAVGIGRPYPVTLERIEAWAEALETRAAVLAPVSAVVAREGDKRS